MKIRRSRELEEHRGEKVPWAGGGQRCYATWRKNSSMRALVQRLWTDHCLVGWLMSAAWSSRDRALDLSILVEADGKRKESDLLGKGNLNHPNFSSHAFTQILSGNFKHTLSPANIRTHTCTCIYRKQPKLLESEILVWIPTISITY